jgi:hypothetical protein
MRKLKYWNVLFVTSLSTIGSKSQHEEANISVLRTLLLGIDALRPQPVLVDSFQSSQRPCIPVRIFRFSGQQKPSELALGNINYFKLRDQTGSL